MGPEPGFEQRRWGYRLGFGLGDEGFHYSVRDGGTRRVFTIAYERFDLHDPVFEVIPASRPGMILFFLCAFSASLAFAASRVPPAATLVLTCLAGLFGVGLILWRTTGLFAVPFSVFVDDHGGEAFRVIRDRQHDAIVAAIAALWRERLRALWSVVDLESDLARERARIDWLLYHDIIDADEHADAVRKLLKAETIGDRPQRLH